MRKLGSIAANAAGGFTLRDLTHLSDSAQIENCMVRNNSDANLTFQNVSGQPVVDAGERDEFHVGQRDVIVVPDAAVSANEIELHMILEGC